MAETRHGPGPPGSRNRPNAFSSFGALFFFGIPVHERPRTFLPPDSAQAVKTPTPGRSGLPRVCMKDRIVQARRAARRRLFDHPTLPPALSCSAAGALSPGRRPMRAATPGRTPFSAPKRRTPFCWPEPQLRRPGRQPRSLRRARTIAMAPVNLSHGSSRRPRRPCRRSSPGVEPSQRSEWKFSLGGMDTADAGPRSNRIAPSHSFDLAPSRFSSHSSKLSRTPGRRPATVFELLDAPPVKPQLRQAVAQGRPASGGARSADLRSLAEWPPRTVPGQRGGGAQAV